MLAAVRIGAIHVVVFAGFGVRRPGRPHPGERLEVGFHRRHDVPQGQGRGAEGDRRPGARRASRTPSSRSWSGTAAAPRRRGPGPRRRLGRLPGGGPRAQRARTSRWNPTSRRSSWRPPARRPSPSSRCTRTAATRSTSRAWRAGASACSPSDVWWSTSDIGWIVGHSYIVYAPLLAGCTTLAYEGAIDHPDPETVWRIVEDFGVTGIFTSPTAVRLLMRYGEAPAHRHDLSAPRARLLRGRSPERPGLGVAAGEGPRGPRPGHRPHVADRDRRPGLRQSVRDRDAADQAGLGARSRCRASMRPS